jgi:cytochrome c-type biogenesis protein CcmH/NrfG
MVLSPSTPTVAQQARGRILVARAQRLNLDTRPDVLRGLLRLRAGDTRGALTAFEAVVRREPENVEAWGLIARVARGHDDALAATAASRLRALAPPVR